ncbi:hypothetical protein BBP40_002700 [Aspergillus hancockii]|nr:hypothetical protein BBP40_002700 [Aspergillus hancockii]
MTTTQLSPFNEETRSRLNDHFSGVGPSHNNRWAALWNAGDAEKWALEHLDDYPVSKGTNGPGKAHFVLGDFFKDDW